MLCLQNVIPFIGILLSQTTTSHLISQHYRLISGPLTWYEAQKFCRVKYTDLATVNNMDDNNRLIHTLGNHVTYSWIGLQKRGYRRWMWSDGRGRAHLTKWAHGEPNNSEGSEWCAELSSEGTWNDIVCGEEKKFVCYERAPDGKKRYVHHSEDKSWVNSLELCRSQHTDMAYVSTEADNSEIANLAKTWTGLIGLHTTVWIGLFNDAWRWSDGKETSFRYWRSGTPNWGDCASVSVSQHHRWVGDNCNKSAAFVCQGDLKVKKRIIRMQVHSGVDLMNSTVSDTLLRKLEADLKRHSLTDFTLTWRSDKNGLIFQHLQELEAGAPAKVGC